MKLARIGGVCLAILVVLSAGATAQDKPKPDLSGTWTIDVPLTAKANGKTAAYGAPLTLRTATDGARNVVESVTLEQTDKTLTVKQPKRQDVVYVLDNKAQKGEVNTRGGKMEVIIKARWDRDRIVTTTVQRTMFEGELRETEYKETRWLDKEGHLNFSLEVSTGDGNYKAVYVKKQ